MLISPFTVAFDTREQLPFSFQNCRIDRRKAFVLTQRATLPTGDYSIVGLEDKVCVERKSLEDLYQTLGRGRERFERELERMQNFECSLVVIEASGAQVMNPALYDPLFHSQMNPVSVMWSIVAFSNRYTKTYWKPAGSRQEAERYTFQFLLKFWKETKNNQDTENG